MSYYAGLDLGRSTSFLVVKDQQGRVFMEQKLRNEAKVLEAALMPYQPITITVEATTHYRWMYDTLTQLGCSVKVAHPLHVRAIAAARVKTDRIDAGTLCDLLRADLLPMSWVPPEPIRELRELLRHRIRLVQDRTRVKNRVSTLLAKLNLHFSATDPCGAAGRQWLSELPLAQTFAWQRDDSLDQLRFLNGKVSRIDSQLKKLAKPQRDVALLTTIPGIGIFSALVILAEVGDIHRFPSAKQLVSYAGLAPGIYQSGNTSHGRGITHQGSSYLRWVLVEASQHVIRHPGQLRHTYIHLMQRKGHGKALVAVARKLLVILYIMLKKQQPFMLDPQAIR